MPIALPRFGLFSFKMKKTWVAVPAYPTSPALVKPIYKDKQPVSPRFGDYKKSDSTSLYMTSLTYIRII